jgi:NADPH-dependent 2,4-dienoyl-CoA reductase/sulfur reductase-like enzyme
MSNGALDLLVIGGGPAGFTTAAAYREAGGRGAVALVADEERMPYARPPLSKELLRGEVVEAELPLADETWLAEHDVRLIGGRAMALDADARTVTLSGGRTLEYARCVLATGAEPSRLPVPGAEDPGVRVLRSLDHLRELQARLSRGAPVVVIGSGFVGCEIAASLRILGHPVALVSDERAPNAARLGDALAERIRGWLEADGVSLLLGAEVERIVRDGDGFAVHAGDAHVDGALVVMATGVVPRSELAAGAGARRSGDGAVCVDGAMRTSRDGLLAAGDVALARNVAAGRPVRVEHWGDALGQGKVAGRTAAGVQATWSDVPGFWSTIGSRTLKHAAWGDGFDDVRVDEHADGGFTAWYGRGGRLVGVLAHEADADYERGRGLIAEGAAW